LVNYQDMRDLVMRPTTGHLNCCWPALICSQPGPRSAFAVVRGQPARREPGS